MTFETELELPSEEAVAIREDWDRYWGMKYDATFKKETVGPVLAELEAEGKIGDVVVDVGSGAYNTMTQLLKGDHKVITVDLCGVQTQSQNSMHLRFNVESLIDESRADTRYAIAKVANFLGIEKGDCADKKHIDTVILSEILNYVDFVNVIKSLKRYLKKGGRLVIVNMPGRGFTHLFSLAGLQRNSVLFALLESEGFVIEKKVLPWKFTERPEGERELIVLVARNGQ